MHFNELSKLLRFYESQLKDNLLSFWMPRCVDQVNGGFFNCFNNAGDHLISRDKYCWSQGRFIWIFSKLASMQSHTFTMEEKNKFLQIAAQGCDFLIKHCLIGKDDWRCVFLMDEFGTPKLAEGVSVLDSSIFADCFTAAGIALYSSVSGDAECWNFAQQLYDSIRDRILRRDFRSLPYPLCEEYRMHSIPMIATNLSCEMYRAAKIMQPEVLQRYLDDVHMFSTDDLMNFVDENNVLHEIIRIDNTFFEGLFGDHINPGHIIEDMWFQYDAMQLLNAPERLEKIAHIAKNAFKLGWDPVYGGYFHFTTSRGREITGAFGDDPCDEPQLRQVYEDWDSKLWWVHSESLYTSLLLYFSTKDPDFLAFYQRVADYVFQTFPNSNPEIGEWEQIRTRDGRPMDKVVALPVKDPYHIMRNIILIIELLDNLRRAPIA